MAFSVNDTANNNTSLFADKYRQQEKLQSNAVRPIQCLCSESIKASYAESVIIITIIIRKLYSAKMPLGGYRGAGGYRKANFKIIELLI